jgi:hypothetical protein
MAQAIPHSYSPHPYRSAVKPSNHCPSCCPISKSNLILSVVVLSTLALLVTGVLAGQNILNVSESGKTGLLTTGGILTSLLIFNRAWALPGRKGDAFLYSGFILGLLSVIIGSLAFHNIGGLAVIGTPGSIALIAAGATYLGLASAILCFFVYISLKTP